MFGERRVQGFGKGHLSSCCAGRWTDHVERVRGEEWTRFSSQADVGTEDHPRNRDGEMDEDPKGTPQPAVDARGRRGSRLDPDSLGNLWLDLKGAGGARRWKTVEGRTGTPRALSQRGRTPPLCKEPLNYPSNAEKENKTTYNLPASRACGRGSAFSVCYLLGTIRVRFHGLVAISVSPRLLL